MIRYAGIDMSEFFNVISIDNSIIPNRVNYSIDIPSRVGEVYNGYKYGTREIEIEVLVRPLNPLDYTQALKDIASALDVSAPARLYLDYINQPDRYYYAVVEGAPKIGEIAQGVGKGKIKFICYNPIEYSDEVKLFTGTNSVIVSNEGQTSAYPTVEVSLDNPASFVQVSNERTGGAILVGQWPNVNMPNPEKAGVVLQDDCKTLTDWLTVGNVLDADREIDGNFKINSGGYGITPSSYGTVNKDGKWRGPARLRNIGQNVKDFEVVVEFEFDSKGKNASDASTTPPTNPDGSNSYKTTANLNVREGRGTNYKILTTMPKGTVVAVSEISGGWGKVSYKGKTGYSSMKYLTLVQTGSTNHVVNTGSKKGLNLRAGRSTSSKIYLSIPNGTPINVSDISSGWGKTTYKGYTGYVYMTYVKPKQSFVMDIQQNSYSVSPQTEETADDKMGVLELYLRDNNNNKLGKVMLTDANAWYEYTHPQAQIGSNIVLKDDDSVPKPQQGTWKDDKGEDITGDVLSGKFGKWNEFSGQFKIRREANKWTIEVNKIKNGQIVATLKTNTLVNANYPTGDLNNFVLYAAQYADAPTPAMVLTSLKVERLNEIPPIAIPKIFKKGDNLRIDCEKNMVYLNDIPCMEYLDIGSGFFGVGAGDTQLKIFSDDRGIYTSASIQERWL